MSSNGNGNGEPYGIPDDLVWDDDNPPIIYGCSSHTEHSPECDGVDCEPEVTTEYQVKLLNEMKAWARARMDPTSIQTNSLHTGCQVNALQKALVDAGLVEQEEVDKNYAEMKYDIYHNIRLEMEDQIKEARTRAMLGLDNGPKLVNPFEQQ